MLNSVYSCLTMAFISQVVAQPNTKLPIPDHMRVRWVNINEISPARLSETNETADEQDAADNNQRHIAVSGSSKYCHGTAGDNRSNRASATPSSAPLHTESQKKVYFRNMRMTPSPNSSHSSCGWSRKAALSFFRGSSPETLEEHNSTSPSYGMRRASAGFRRQDRLHDLEQNIDGNGLLPDRLLAPSKRIGPPTDLVAQRRYSLSNPPDSPDDFNAAEEVEGVEVSPTVREIPIRQHEPSAETVNISLSPASSPGWDNDDSEDSPKRLLTISPVPLPASSLDVFKRREEGNEELLSGENQVTTQASSTESAMQQLEDNAEGHSLETPKTPIREDDCQGAFSPTTQSHEDDGLQNSPNVSEHQKPSPSIPSSPLNQSSQTQVKCSVSKSPKQGASLVSANTPEKPNSPGKDDTTFSKDLIMPSEGESLEGYLIQQLENSPSSSQRERTEFVRSWIFRGESNLAEKEAFLDMQTSTSGSSVVDDDGRILALDECSKDGESQKDETEKASPEEDKGDLISLIASPSPSSKLEMPWTSISVLKESKDAVSSRPHNKHLDCLGFSTVKVMPFTETIDGSAAIVFPENVIQGTFMIHVVATSDFNRVDSEGWREFIFPAFDAPARGTKGVIFFNFPEDRGSFEFDTKALPWASIQGGSLLAQFDLSEGITLPVHMLNTQTHTLKGGFAIDNTIKSTYRLSESINDCFTIEYTATCEFKVTRQNFWAERCCFHIILEEGPWGRFEYSLDEHEWHVRLDSDERFSVGDTEIKVTCLFTDIGEPFRISWAVDMKGLPAKGWVPKIRPICPDEHSPRPAWRQNSGMRYEGAVSATVLDVAGNEFNVEEILGDDEEIPDDPNETTDCNMENHMESQDAPQDEVYDELASGAIQCGKNTLEDGDRFDRRVRGVKPESDTSSEFIDHSGSPWLEPNFGMVTFLIPLLFIIAELLRKIIGYKICQIGRFLKRIVRRVGIRTWLKIGSLVYLGSLSMGASPIQRLDEIVHALAVVERQATVSMASPLRGRGGETVVRERPGLLTMQSSLENLCDALGGLESEVVPKGYFSASVPADEFWVNLKGHAIGKPDEPVGSTGPEDQKGKSGSFSESESEKRVSREADTVSDSIAKPVPLQPGQTSQVRMPSMRDKIDQFLGWRDPEGF